jgi:hypothetical protein
MDRISPLTLVPYISGGSPYARELVLALARVGRLEYHVYAPRIATTVWMSSPAVTPSAPRSITRAQRFSWDECARLHDDVYTDAHA